MIFTLCYMLYQTITEKTFSIVSNPDRRDTVLITGASKGIGKEIAKLFVRDGVNLIMVARDLQDMEDAKQQFLKINSKVQIYCIQADFGTDDDAPQNVFDQVTNGDTYKHLRLKYLVNNAGVCLRGQFLEIPLDRQLAMVNLLTISYTKMCYLFGNYFGKLIDDKKNNDQQEEIYRILNTASIGGVLISPLMATYSAAKHYTHAFSMAFGEEALCRYDGRLTVTSLCPGFTDSDAIPKAGLEKTNAFAMGMNDKTERVGQVAYKAMMKGWRYAIVGWGNNIMVWLQRAILPFKWSFKFLEFGNSDTDAMLENPEMMLKRGYVTKHANENEHVNIKKQ
ncbi:very-long-chain 3-oxoacyl-CoA reductase [Acrasis kona]|uniref:Very-long-chain 3-oxoacyl-CoA reductase n=1 Tax=Acrasis kona TaxID=1008807 RepID=A0AAW2Z8Y8_9EUKA